MSEKNQATITTGTLIPIGTAIAAFLVVLGAAINAAVSWHTWRLGDQSWKTRIENLVEGMAENQWSRSDQQGWRDRLEDQNEGVLKVPPLPPTRPRR